MRCRRNAHRERETMDTQPIETDYLVIGAGATAMAFVDTLLSETDAHVVMVDRHHRLAVTGTTPIHSSLCISRPPSTA